MKPDWRDAPDWANWLARDEDGTWTWFAYRPKPYSGEWESISPKSETAGYSRNKWEESLEKRP